MRLKTTHRSRFLLWLGRSSVRAISAWRASWGTIKSGSLVLVSYLVVSTVTSAYGLGIDFQKQVQPILAQHCTHCHGADEGTRHGGLRLDLAEQAYRGGDSGQPAIVPGNPELSAMLSRVHATDPAEVMPPPEEKKPLDAQQLAILKQWIAEGAHYETHWAFAAPRKLIPPVEHDPIINGLSTAENAISPNPIDSIIAAKHLEKGWATEPRASDSTLCRRLYLDLIGLPPSPQDVEDYAKTGHQATVEKLLASERYAEKWARHWLDAARYSDTNGYEKDLRRDQWVWRDWVIRAIQNDMPYNQFIIEQIAGDLLPNATQDSMIATGFLRNSMLNEEGAIIPEQFRMVEMFDRIDCIGKSVLGLSAQCAQCHTHKFDPITHDEYYGMFAYLNNTYEAKSWVYDADQQKKIAEIRANVSQAEDRIRLMEPNWKALIADFEKQIIGQQPDWQPITFTQLESISGLNHPTHEADDQSILMLGHTSVDVFMATPLEATGITGARIELLTHGDLPFLGPGRNRVGGWSVEEWEILTKLPEATDWVKLKVINPTADYSNEDQKFEEGKKSKGPVAYLVDGSDATGWTADRGNALRNQASVAAVQFESPLTLPPGSQIKMVLRMSGLHGNEMIGCCRFSLTHKENPTVTKLNSGAADLFVDHEAVLAVQTDASQRTAKQETAIFSAWRKSKPEFQEMNAEIDRQLASFPEGVTSVMHLAERSGSKTRKTYLLDRGSWDKPSHEVRPTTPNAFRFVSTNNSQPTTVESSVKTDSEVVTPGTNRLDFARWLVDPRSPLAARVAANRIWQTVFGVGIVETSEDMGVRVAVPEYRELLDWMAADFVENGWSQKHLLRLIVNSDAYQRQSKANPESFREDPTNSRLTRGPRFRVDAEVVRDIALTASGLMHHQLFGLPVIPPVPQNVLDYNYVYPSYWTPAQGSERYRRALYVFRKRSMPDPAMSSMDAPNGDVSCARRVRSDTPLAALTGLNETIFVEAAQAFALRVLREAGTSEQQRIDYAYQLCTSRLPSPNESQAIMKLLASQRERIAQGWLNPREIATGDPAKLPQLPADASPQDAAAWTLVGRVMLNLDETLSKN